MTGTAGATGAPLPDGEYPVLVIDVESGLTDTGVAVSHLEVTVLSGDHKGDVVSLSAVGLAGTFIELIGMPGTVSVASDSLRFTLDDQP